jgi:FkbH-like protein
MERKKCIVLDLDNTLWGGVVGEDGPENLALSLAPPGNSYMAFQQALLDHYDRGILLAINSRNNPHDALIVIRTNPNMILKEKHFAAIRMNWNDKAENLRELAKELNISLDSLVFLDDDQTNRELVRATLPEVETPDLPTDPSEYTRFLNTLPYFPASAITDEDKMRGNLYVTERLRKEAEKHHATKEEFLTSLGLVITIYEDDSAAVIRLAQMTEKTNQFNINKRPLSENEVSALIASPDHHVFYAKLSDKFGDYGIVLLAVVDIGADSWHLSTMLMSCRAFGRNIESAFLKYIAERAEHAGTNVLTIAFQESPKNAPAKEFVDQIFIQGSIAVAQVVPAPTWIKIAL